MLEVLIFEHGSSESITCSPVIGSSYRRRWQTSGWAEGTTVRSGKSAGTVVSEGSANDHQSLTARLHAKHEHSPRPAFALVECWIFFTLSLLLLTLLIRPCVGGRIALGHIDVGSRFTLTTQSPHHPCK